MSANDYDTKVIEFLTETENLRAALEVADHVLDVKKLLVLKFWRTIRERVQGVVAQYPSWIVQTDTDDKLFRATGEPGITIRPQQPNSDPGYFGFKLGTDAAGTFYGIQCNGKRYTDLRSMAMKLSEFRRVKDQIEAFPSENWGHYWLIGRYMNELTNHKGLSENENVVRLSQRDTLADGVSTIFTELFQTYVEPMDSINIALTKTAKI